MKKYNLEDVMLQYVETKNGDLITEDVYTEIKKLAYKICNRFMINNPQYRDFDETMSIINCKLWRYIHTYDRNKGCGIISFMGMIMYSAILEDIRYTKSHTNNYTNVSLYDIVLSDEKDVAYYELIQDKKSLLYVDIMIINESAKPIIDKVLIDLENSYGNRSGKRSVLNENARHIFKFKYLGYRNKKIAEIYGCNVSTVSRFVVKMRKKIYEQLIIHGII